MTYFNLFLQFIFFHLYLADEMLRIETSTALEEVCYFNFKNVFKHF